MPYKYSLYNEFHVRWIGHGKAHIEGRIYSMSISCVAPHAQGKSAKDRIFGASEAAQNRIKEIGADKVTNSTIGVMLDNDGNFVVLPTVAKVYHSLSDAELFRYAPAGKDVSFDLTNTSPHGEKVLVNANQVGVYN